MNSLIHVRCMAYMKVGCMICVVYLDELFSDVLYRLLHRHSDTLQEVPVLLSAMVFEVMVFSHGPIETLGTLQLSVTAVSSNGLWKWMEAIRTSVSWWEKSVKWWKREFLKTHLHAWREGLDQTRNHDGGKVIQSSRFLIVSFAQMSFGEILWTRKYTNELVS